MTKDDEDSPLCRICRSGDVEDGVLFSPCLCTGSIEFVHNNCLKDWLKVTKKDKCELCGYRLEFKSVFAEIPQRLPLLLVLRRLIYSLMSSIALVFRVILVATTWLALLPYSILWITRFYFLVAELLAVQAGLLFKEGGRESMRIVTGEICEVKVDMSSLMVAATLATEEIQNGPHPSVDILSAVFAEVFRGQMITTIVVVCFVCAFLLREFVLQNATLIHPLEEPLDPVNPLPNPPFVIHNNDAPGALDLIVAANPDLDQVFNYLGDNVEEEGSWEDVEDDEDFDFQSDEDDDEDADEESEDGDMGITEGDARDNATGRDWWSEIEGTNLVMGEVGGSSSQDMTGPSYAHVFNFDPDSMDKELEDLQAEQDQYYHRLNRSAPPPARTDGLPIRPLPTLARRIRTARRQTAPPVPAAGPAVGIARTFLVPPMLEYNGAGVRNARQVAALALAARRRRRDRHGHARGRGRNGEEGDDDDDEEEEEDVDPRHHHHHHMREDDEFGADEDFIEADGILEAIGIRGNVMALLQNFALMLSLITVAMGATLFLPLLVGKVFTAADALRLFTLPLKLCQRISDPIFDSVVALPVRILRRALVSLVLPLSTHAAPFLNLLSTIISSTATLRKYSDPVSTSTSAPTKSAYSIALSITSTTTSLPTALLGLFRGIGTTWFSMAVNDATRDRVLSTLLGYVVIFSIFGIWLSNQKDTSVQLKSVIKTLMVLVKVVAFVATEIIAFPSMCGLILSFVTIPIFDTSITGRLAYYSRSGFSGFFLTWLSGTLWMFMFSVVIDAFRKIVRPGVLFWVRDPDSVDFHPVREIIERKATVQARKIAISGLLYGAIIVSTCGAGVLVLRLAVGKIRWTYQPLSTIPIDLLVFRFVIPFVLHHLEPRSRMRVLFEQWVHFAAGKLRFTSFIFGKRAPAEERSRRRFWSKWWSKEVAMVDTVVENGVEYAKDGGFARVPAFDGVRVPQKKKRKMVIRVQEDGTPFDGDVEAFTTIVEQIIEMVTARNDDKYQIVYLPPNVRVRAVLFIAALWLGSSIAMVGALAITILVGRHLFSYVIPPHTIVHDGYSAVVGTFSLLLIPLASHVVKIARSHQRLKYGKLVDAGRCLAAVTMVGLILPLILSIYINLFILFPLSLRPNAVRLTEMPTLHFWSVWSTGVIVLSILNEFAQTKFAYGSNAVAVVEFHKVWRSKRRVVLIAAGQILPEVVRKEGRKMEAIKLLNQLAWKISSEIGFALLLPLLVAFTSRCLPGTWGTTAAGRNFYSDCEGATLICSIIRHAAFALRYSGRAYHAWTVKVKEDEFLVERVLQNYVPEGRTSKSAKAKGKEREVIAEEN